MAIRARWKKWANNSKSLGNASARSKPKRLRKLRHPTRIRHLQGFLEARKRLKSVVNYSIFAKAHGFMRPFFSASSSARLKRRREALRLDPTSLRTAIVVGLRGLRDCDCVLQVAL